MCMGTFYMSGLRTLHFASRDPYAGSVDLLGKTWYLSKKPIKVFGPANPALEIIIMAMAVEQECSALARNDAMTEVVVLVQILLQQGQFVSNIRASRSVGR